MSSPTRCRHWPARRSRRSASTWWPGPPLRWPPCRNSRPRPWLPASWTAATSGAPTCSRLWGHWRHYWGPSATSPSPRRARHCMCPTPSTPSRSSTLHCAAGWPSGSRRSPRSSRWRAASRRDAKPSPVRSPHPTTRSPHASPTRDSTTITCGNGSRRSLPRAPSAARPHAGGRFSRTGWACPRSRRPRSGRTRRRRPSAWPAPNCATAPSTPPSTRGG